MENTNFIDEVYDKFYDEMKKSVSFWPLSNNGKKAFYICISSILKKLFNQEDIDVCELLAKIKVSLVTSSPANNNIKSTPSFCPYFIIENDRNEQALIQIKMEILGAKQNHDEKDPEKRFYEPFEVSANISAKIIAPFMKRKYQIIDYHTPVLYSTDEDNKTSLYSLLKEKTVSKEYDYIEKNDFGYRVENNNKVGRISIIRKDFNIPTKYDEITKISKDDEVDILLSKRNETKYLVDRVRIKNKVGAYCYTKDYHDRYDYSQDRSFSHEYIKKAYIAPIFDTLECLEIQNKLYLVVSINGKYGVLDPFKHKFICSTIFDVITKINIMDDESLTIYGEIDGNEYYYQNNILIKNEQCEVVLSDEFVLAREKIERQAKK